jgi:hypothetical protein
MDPMRNMLRPPHRGRALAGAGAVAVVGLGLAWALEVEQRPPVSFASAVAYPNAGERALLSSLPGFVHGCHRFIQGLAVAGVTCLIGADHPGAATLSYQQFANFADLEAHYQRVLTVRARGARVPSGSCAVSPDFLATSSYPTAGHAQQRSDASGHLFCSLDLGVPRMVWTNGGQLILAQAVGDGTGPDAQGRLLDFWEGAGPVPAPVSRGASPDKMVTILYERYLRREPESDFVLAFWVDRLQGKGLSTVRNEFAGSSEARFHFTLPILGG